MCVVRVLDELLQDRELILVAIPKVVGYQVNVSKFVVMKAAHDLCEIPPLDS